MTEMLKFIPVNWPKLLGLFYMYLFGMSFYIGIKAYIIFENCGLDLNSIMSSRCHSYAHPTSITTVKAISYDFPDISHKIR